jgi:hypothetical protein
MVLFLREETVMIRRVVITGSLLIGVLFAAASSAVAIDEILKLTPESALGVVVVNRPATLDAKFQALAQEMQLPPFSPLTMLKQRLKIGEGVKETGTVGLILLPGDDDSSAPAPILLIPVTDYTKFIEPLEPENAADAVTKLKLLPGDTYVRNIGNYAVMTDEEHREVLEKSLKLAKDIPAGLAPWRDWLSGQDAAGIALSPGIKQFSAKVQEGLAATKSMLEGGNDQMQKTAAVFDLYALLFQTAETEVDAVGFGVQLDKQKTLRLTKRVALTPGGKWAQYAAQVHAAKDPLLAGLPDEPFVAAGGAALSDSLLSGFMTASAEIIKAMPGYYGLNDEQVAKVAEATKKSNLHGNQSMAFLLGVGEENEPIYAGLAGVVRVDDAQAYMASYEKFITEYAALVKEIGSPMLGVFEIEKSDVGGIAGLQITVQMPQPPDNEQAPQFNAMMETMFGNGGKAVCWIVPADEHHIVMGYVNQDCVSRMIEVIKQGKPGLEANADVAKTMALLLPDAAAAGYVSLAGAVSFVKRIVATVVPQAGISQKIPDFPPTPPIGFSLTTSPNEVQTSAIVPVEVLKAVVPYVNKVQQAALTDTPSEAP